jgi:hypothetical protein
MKNGNTQERAVLGCKATISVWVMQIKGIPFLFPGKKGMNRERWGMNRE